MQVELLNERLLPNCDLSGYSGVDLACIGDIFGRASWTWTQRGVHLWRYVNKLSVSVAQIDGGSQV